MKRGVIYFVIFLILIISLYNIEQKYVHKKGMEKITSESMIDSMASVSVSILVVANPPIVIIDSPQNKSYFSGDNITLNYIASDTNGVDSVWYNLDNGENTTLTNNITFNTDEGSHTLYIFATDSSDNLNDSEFVSFFIGNPNEENIVDANGYVEFNDPTIDEVIDKISNLPIGSKTNATLYNMTKPNSWVTPSSSLVESVFEYFEINVNESTAGGSYTIYFNLSQAELGITSANDVRLFIYENSGWGELTTAIIDSSSDPLSFSAVTTHFSDFLIGKKASTTPPPTGGAVSGGGSAAAGGGIGEKKPSFSVDQEFLKILVKKNEILKRPIKITNTGNTILDLIIDLQGLKDVVSISENSFKLNKDEEKLIDLNLITGKGVAPGVYVGSILIKAGENVVKLIKTIIEIESEKVLFDISLNVPLDYKTVKPGSEFVVQSTLINMGGLTNVDISIEYNIKNSKGEIVIKDQESVIVGSQASFTKKFLIPKDLPLGEYVISAVVSYKDSVGTSSETFKVGEKEKFFNIFNISVISGILVVLILMILWERMGLKNIEKLQKERLGKLVKKRPEMEESDVKKRLEKELKLLGESFEAGYITKTAYDKSKERIKSLLK